MNCKLMQHRLLQADRPDRPPPEVQCHLASCRVCRDWQQRLIQMERSVPLLPVPPSAARAELLQRLLKTDHRPTPHPYPPRDLGRVRMGAKGAPWRWARILPALPATIAPVRFLRRWRWQAAGAAAATVLLALCWWMLRGPQETLKMRPAPDPLLARLLQCDLRLAQAKTPSERLEGLADLASSLQVEMNNLVRAADGTDLMELAQRYKQVVDDGLVQRAGDLPPAERRRVLRPIVAQLAQARRDAQSLAQDVPAAAESLQLLAAAANNGNGRLGLLLQE